MSCFVDLEWNTIPRTSISHVIQISAFYVDGECVDECNIYVKPRYSFREHNYIA